MAELSIFSRIIVKYLPKPVRDMFSEADQLRYKIHMLSPPSPNNQISLHALHALLHQRSLLAALTVFHSELGDVFQLPLPGFNPLMLVGAEANRFVLVEERDAFRWRAEHDPCRAPESECGSVG